MSGLNEHGKALNDLGLQAGLHQHTGSAVDLRDEVYAVMESVDTRVMKFAPDVGQLQKAGADAAKVVADFLPIVVHMHLKDYSGGPHFAGYCPLGQGKVDLAQILRLMNDAHPDAKRDGGARWFGRSALHAAPDRRDQQGVPRRAGLPLPPDSRRTRAAIPRALRFP